LKNVAIKPKIVIGTETIVAISPPDRPDFDDSAVVDVGLELEVEVELAIVDAPEPGVADGTSTLLQLFSFKIAISLQGREIELDAILSLVVVAKVTSPTQ
jgi:hypothetical protein